MEQGYEQREERKAAFYESLQAVVHILKFMEECTYEDIDFDPTDSFDPVAQKKSGCRKVCPESRWL